MNFAPRNLKPGYGLATLLNKQMRNVKTGLWSKLFSDLFGLPPSHTASLVSMLQHLFSVL